MQKTQFFGGQILNRKDVEVTKLPEQIVFFIVFLGISKKTKGEKGEHLGIDTPKKKLAWWLQLGFFTERA